MQDRAAKAIIERAEKEGKLQPGGIIVEGTGGNTGVALAQIGRAKGYRVVICMPECIGQEKIDTQRRFGAEVHLQPLVPFSDPRNFARRPETLAKELGGVFTNQFENLANFQAHFSTTGPEIFHQTNGKIDAFITSAGTGGTIAGVSAFLHEVDPSIRSYLVDPAGSILHDYVNNTINNTNETSALTTASTTIEGIGIGRITANFAKAKLVGAKQVADKEAIEMVYYLMRNEGLAVGPSSALNVCGAVKVARELGPGHVIVTLLCDGGDRCEIYS